MATDPTTGQTILTPRFDQQYAGFLDPTQFGQIAAGQSQAGLLGQLGQQMLQAGYVPNSGRGGAIAQMIQALAGGMMLKKAQDQIAGLSSQQAEAMNAAEQKKHAQDQADKDAEMQRAISQATGIDKGKLQTAHEFAPITSADAAAAAQALIPAEAAKAGAISAAQLPSQTALEKMKGGYQLGAAQIAADATNRRGYVVPTGSGDSVVISPQGNEIYRTTTPGGGKLTPADTALNAADVNALEKLNVRKAGAVQLQSNLVNWAASYTGQDPAVLTKMSPDELAKAVAKTPATTAIANINPLGNRGLDAISNDISINAATTKRDNPTEEIVKAEQRNTVSRYKTPGENADIIKNHFHDIQQLQQQIDATTGRIGARSTPGQGRIPAADQGPVNPPVGMPQQAVAPASGVHYIFDPKSGQLVPAQQ